MKRIQLKNGFIDLVKVCKDEEICTGVRTDCPGAPWLWFDGGKILIVLSIIGISQLPQTGYVTMRVI